MKGRDLGLQVNWPVLHSQEFLVLKSARFGFKYHVEHIFITSGSIFIYLCVIIKNTLKVLCL